ncbi:MAG: hypothetical protein U9Q30_03190, partial [Campylobacterota bacterium]|nr:hypothetical protein [Campylobacterota bacterium]
MQNNHLEGLKDIKDIVYIPDYSLYILLSITTIVIAILFYLIFRYITRIKKTKILTKKEIAYNNLKNLNFNNTKDSVYKFTQDGNLFLNDKNRDSYERIVSSLGIYKYKKD